MSAQIAGFRPGDKVPVTYLRSGKEYTANVTLKKRSDVVTANAASRLGGDLASLTRSKAASYGVTGGVVVNKVNDGGILKIARVSPGFVIVSVITSEGEQEVNSVEDLNRIVQGQAGSIRIRGFYPDYGESYTYTLNLER